MKFARLSRIALTLAVVAVACRAASDTPSAPSTPAVAAESAQAPRGAVQRVGPDDLLSVSVADLPELNRNFRVSADGTLSLPMLPQPIPVAGKFTPEIEREIGSALVKEQILVKPVVAVSIAEYRSAPVTVLGAVHHPVSFQAFGDLRLLDAITKAEGLSDNAGPEILVTRSHDLNGAPTDGLVQRISVHDLIDEGNPDLNIRLYGGEEIRVPEGGRIYVLGNVRKPGVFPIGDNGDATVMKVVAECEGLAPFASKHSFIYRKQPGQAERAEISVDVQAIMKRKSPDVKLQPNDIFYVPDDKHRRLTAETLDKLVGFGMGTASGFIIFH